jgi:parallel beta-helix repeat protein
VLLFAKSALFKPIGTEMPKANVEFKRCIVGAVALGGALMAATPSAWAWGSNSIRSCPVTLSVPGKYQLTRDLICPGAIAISIEANNVALYLAGHTITGSKGFPGIVVRSPSIFPTHLGGILIQNGKVQGFGRGVYLQTVADVRIERVSAISNDEGFLCSDCTNVRFRKNTASDSTDYAMLLIFASNNKVTDYAMLLIFASNNKVIGNTMSDNHIGIVVSQGSINNRLADNVAINNELADLEDANAPILDVCANTWPNNTFLTTSGAGASCIH